MSNERKLEQARSDVSEAAERLNALEQEALGAAPSKRRALVPDLLEARELYRLALADLQIAQEIVEAGDRTALERALAEAQGAVEQAWQLRQEVARQLNVAMDEQRRFVSIGLRALRQAEGEAAANLRQRELAEQVAGLKVAARQAQRRLNTAMAEQDRAAAALEANRQAEFDAGLLTSVRDATGGRP